MDAEHLEFENESFEHITFFYSLMYMNMQEQEAAIREAVRVCKENGSIHIWDCEIESAYPVPFTVDLSIRLPHETINTTYGIVKKDTQSKEIVVSLCEKAGLTITKEELNGGSFHLVCRK